ncbi:uncharacterized protein LOC127355220 isoform X4 [Dicentrarchus labrax]|uniref:uncharacterized protein LOC127355220 isoform X4 n=1 Tax=Dicentrarchus labrax TaxID=13489 RepID=UPI0021F50112|nr:uncharacterized protein LOC127355220 isoform X4 [Dicentrarchus labrax]
MCPRVSCRDQEEGAAGERGRGGGGGGRGGGEQEEHGAVSAQGAVQEQQREPEETHSVSEELSDTVSIIPVSQGLTSPWKPSSSSPQATTFNPNLATYDPWHVHLSLHRRCCPGRPVPLTASSPETTNSNRSLGCSSSSTEDLDSASSSRETSPCSSFSPKDHFRSRGGPDTGSSDRSRGGPDTGSSDRSRGGRDTGSCDRSRGGPDTGSSDRFRGGPDTGSCDRSRGGPDTGSSDRFRGDPDTGSCDRSRGGPSGSLEGSASRTSSDESSTPVASITCSPSGSTSSLNQPAGGCNGVLQSGGTSSPWGGGSRKFSAPVLRFTRQLSVGGLGSSAGVHQSQNYHPFPNRKTPRISEAAKRLGMYSSF